MAATAPAACAFATLKAKVHLLSARGISAIAPVRDPLLGWEQPSPPPPSRETSRIGAVRGLEILGPSPNTALMRCKLEGTLDPATRTLEKKTCEFVVAPTVIADGDGPG